MPSLQELAKEHGQLARPAPDGDPYSAAHMGASALHGWAWHEHHYGPVELSSDDYSRALGAAAQGKRHAPADMRAGPKPPRKASKPKKIEPPPFSCGDEETDR